MLRINELYQLDLGVQGENLAREITIDVSDWLVNHPNASVTIWHKRNGDSVPSATGAVFNAAEGTVTWPLYDTDTYAAGQGLAEIRLVEDGVIKKSRPVVTSVSPSVTLSGTIVGSGWQNYINAVDDIRQEAVTAKNGAEAAQEAAETAQGKAEDAQEAAEEAQGKAEDAQDAAEDAQAAAELAATRGPYIDDTTGKWMVWDAEQGGYVNTGVTAQGPQGPKGDPGSMDNVTAQSIKMAPADDTKVYNAINAKANKEDTELTTTLSRGRRDDSTTGSGSFAFGGSVIASGEYSHAEGEQTAAVAFSAHAEGEDTVSSGRASHAEGYNGMATGNYSHSEGISNLATGANSHAEGDNNTAAGVSSHAEGSGTKASKNAQHTGGKYNVEDTDTSSDYGKYAEIIGNGTGNNARSNARALDWDGNEYLNGDLYVDCNSSSGSGSKVAKLTDIPSVINNLTSSSTTDALSAAQGKTLYDKIIKATNKGTFTTLSDVEGSGGLMDILNSVLAETETYSTNFFRVAAGADVDIFKNTYIYFCILYKGSDTGNYCHLIMYPNASKAPINGLKLSTSTWYFDELTYESVHFGNLGTTQNPVTSRNNIPLNWIGNVLFDESISPSGVKRSHSVIKWGLSTTRYTILAIDQYENKMYLFVNYDGTIKDWRSIEPDAAFARSTNTIPSNSLLSSYTAPGIYTVSNKTTAQTISDIPYSESGGRLEVKETIASGTGEYIKQIYYPAAIVNFYIRNKTTGGFGHWFQSNMTDTGS